MFGPSNTHRPIFTRPAQPRRVQQRALPYYRSRDARPWRVWTLLLVCLVIIGIGWLLLFSPVLSVKDIQISGLQRMPHNEALAVVENELSHRWLGIFNRRAMLLLPSKAITQSLKSLPAVKDVALKRRLPNHLIINIDERLASIQWESNGQRYEVDLEGRIIRSIDVANQSDLASSLPRIVDTANSTTTIGAIITTPELVQLVIDAVSGPQGRGSDLFSLGSSPNEVYVHVGSVKVLLTTNEPLEEQYRSARSVMVSIPRQDIERLDVIDVRLPALPTYKLR